jgi:hypothetical protein
MPDVIPSPVDVAQLLAEVEDRLSRDESKVERHSHDESGHFDAHRNRQMSKYRLSRPNVLCESCPEIIR